MKARMTVGILLLFGVVAAFSAGITYYLAPRKITAEVYSLKVSDTQKYGCTMKMGATMFGRANYDQKSIENIDGSIFTKDDTKVGMTISDKILKFNTSASVGVGDVEGAEFIILKNDDSQLIAILYDESGLEPGINTVVLNKTNGLAVWTKAKPSFVTIPLPEAQVYYLECR